MSLDAEVRILDDSEVELIVRGAYRILEEVGNIVENETLKGILEHHGAVRGETSDIVRFPPRVLDELVAGSSEEYDRLPGLDASCTLPFGDRAAYSNGIECTAGTYPTVMLDLDGHVKDHTVRSVADMTRLADWLPNIDRLGAMGVPSDVPGELGPLYQRVIAWKYAERKKSNSGEVRDASLIPYIVDMAAIMSDYKERPLRDYAFGEVELISPLKFARCEADIFVDLWRRDLLCGIGFMHSCGGTAPVTLAGTLVLNLAENLFINLLYRHCYGLRKLWFQTNSSVMDMRSGMFPFGRPERGLMILAVGQIARHFGAGLWASAIYPDAKAPSLEAGLQSAFNTVPAILAGSLGLECFGLLSGAEMNSPVQLVIDNDYCGALKRFARGLEVNDETLALDAIREVGPGGIFTPLEHTARLFRKEHWQPTLFSRESLNAWLASGARTDVDLARDICIRVMEEHHPHNIPEDVERDLFHVVESAARHFGVSAPHPEGWNTR